MIDVIKIRTVYTVRTPVTIFFALFETCYNEIIYLAGNIVFITSDDLLRNYFA